MTRGRGKREKRAGSHSLDNHGAGTLAGPTTRPFDSRRLRPSAGSEMLGLGLRRGSSRADAKPPGLVFEAKNRRRLRVASGGRRDIRW